MTSGVSGGPHSTSSSSTMQVGQQQHSMSSSGSQQAPGPPSQQQSDQQQLMSPAGAASAGGTQSVPMGQPMTAGGFQPTLISSPLGAPNAAPAQYQYVVINQQGQAVLQPANFSFPGMSTMPTAQNPGQQYIITSSIPQAAKQGSQPQLMTSGAPVSMSQTVSKSVAAQQPTYTLSSAGLMSQAGGPQPQTFMIAHQMGGSPTLQAAASNIVTTTSMPSHIKAEPGKQMHQQATQQPQQVGAQQPMILPPGMTYVNTQTAPGQAFIQNGQIFVRAPAPQDGQTTSQLMFSPQAMPMQPQPTLQPGLATQQLPPGLTTSMQPMTSMAVTSGSTVVRAPMAYPSPIPSGKTQISRAPPTLLPATSTSTSSTNRGSTSSASFMTQPSPKSKQKMSPRQPPLSTKGMTTAQATKSILNSIKNQVGSSVSPPVLTSSASPLSLAPGSPSAGGPPVLQTSLTAPPPPNSHSQPPLLHPMMMPTSGSATTTSSFVNGKPMSMPMPNNISRPLDTSGKVPIMPSIKKAVNPAISAAPMEPISKSVDSSNDNKNAMKPPQECLTHVIDGHVIHESSQPFPLEDDIKGRHRKKSESKSNNALNSSSVAPSLVSNRPLTTVTTPTSTAIAPNLTSRQDSSEKKRGPGRPPGSTKQNIEQQRLLQQQQQALQSNDIVKVNKDGGPANKKAKTDFESSPPALANKAAGVSEVKAKYNIDVTTNNPLKWNVTQVCDFVKNLPGCSDYVEDFQLQEIDGQALMLLKADHLMSAMAIKLGPALKICNAIEAMREELKQN